MVASRAPDRQKGVTVITCYPVAIWVFAVAVALSQLGIGAQYFQTLFMGIVVALALAFGLAFGLGGQEAAARFIEKTREEMHKHDHM